MEQVRHYTVFKFYFRFKTIMKFTGKTTLIRLMAGSLTPDAGSGEIPSLNISYKPQKISPKSQSTVRVLLHDKVRDAYTHPQVFLKTFYINRIHSLNFNFFLKVCGGRDEAVENRRHYRSGGSEFIWW